MQRATIKIASQILLLVQHKHIKQHNTRDDNSVPSATKKYNFLLFTKSTKSATEYLQSVISTCIYTSQNNLSPTTRLVSCPQYSSGEIKV